MLLSYVHCFGPQSEQPELCIVPDKPDQFSVPARVDTIGVTDAGVFRVGPAETFVAKVDPEDGGLIIEPVKPSKLFITPDLPEQPGVKARSIKILKNEEGRCKSYYLADRPDEKHWQEWDPTKKRMS